MNSSQENGAGVTEKHIHKLGVHADLRAGLVEGCGLEIVGQRRSSEFWPHAKESAGTCVHIYTHTRGSGEEQL